MQQIRSFGGFIHNDENQATEFHLGKFQALLSALKNQALREKKTSKNILKNAVLYISLYISEFFEKTRNLTTSVTNTLNWSSTK